MWSHPRNRMSVWNLCSKFPSCLTSFRAVSSKFPHCRRLDAFLVFIMEQTLTFFFYWFCCWWFVCFGLLAVMAWHFSEEPRPVSGFVWWARIIRWLNVLARTQPRWRVSFLPRLMKRHSGSVCKERRLLWVICLKLCRSGISLSGLICTARVWWMRLLNGPHWCSYSLIKHRK